jgi:diguanylate cyclase (GGDEF)-like protein
MACDLKELRNLPLVPLLDCAFDGAALAVPAPWRFVYANQALAELTGASQGELVGRHVDEVIRNASDRLLADSLDAVWSGRQQEEIVSADLICHDQTRCAIRLRVVRLVLNGESILGMHIRRAADAHCEEAAVLAERRDPLTELPDRAFLLARLDSLLRSEPAGKHRFAVLFVDLDNFKQVNDAHGHLVGDGVIREVARRMTDCVRDQDCVVRFGGDEFVVILERVHGLEEVQRVIGRLRCALRQPIALPNGEVQLSASVGSAISTPECRTPEELLTAADRDMYASKRAAGN